MSVKKRPTMPAPVAVSKGMPLMRPSSGAPLPLVKSTAKWTALPAGLEMSAASSMKSTVPQLMGAACAATAKARKPAPVARRAFLS